MEFFGPSHVKKVYQFNSDINKEKHFPEHCSCDIFTPKSSENYSFESQPSGLPNTDSTMNSSFNHNTAPFENTSTFFNIYTRFAKCKWYFVDLSSISLSLTHTLLRQWSILGQELQIWDQSFERMIIAAFQVLGYVGFPIEEFGVVNKIRSGPNFC